MFGFLRKKGGHGEGPDFSHVDSVPKAEALFNQGKLEKLLMRPSCFGGTDNALNTLYVPIGTAELKERIDRNTIAVLASEGKVTQYSAKPEYQGKSVVPIAVTVEASEPGSFTATINIWGEALKRATPASTAQPGRGASDLSFTVEEVFYIKPPVDRVILVGTIAEGEVRVGDRLVVHTLAGPVDVLLDNIEGYLVGSLKQASKGQQVGLRLVGIRKDQASRGDRVTAAVGG